MKGDLVMKRFIVYSVCSAALVLTGCASEQHIREYMQTGTESVNQISKSILGAKRAELADDPGILDTYEKDIDDVIVQQRTLFATLKKEIEEEKQQREALVSALASIAIETLPAGPSAVQVAKALGFKIDTAEEKAIEAANAKTEEVEMTANENKEEIATLTGTTEGIAKETEILEGRIDKIEEDTAKLLDENYTVRTDFAVARERFNSLSNSMQEKLRNVPENVVAELTKLKADDAAFREQFQRQIQLTNAEMKALEGMSTEEIMALLIAASGATGASRLMARSRRNELRGEIAKVAERLPMARSGRTELQEERKRATGNTPG
jgi:hypothetical protein